MGAFGKIGRFGRFGRLVNLVEIVGQYWVGSRYFFLGAIVFEKGIDFFLWMGYNGENILEVSTMRLGKKVISILNSALLAVAMVQPLGTVSYASGFSDVNSTDWYYAAVEFVSAEGLMSGTGAGVFSPYVSTSRAMFVGVLYRMAGSPAAETTGQYTDVVATDWYSDAVDWAREKGVASGRGDGIFNPHVELTREQLVVMLYGYEQQLYGTPSSSGVELTFSDMSEFNLWSTAATKWAVAQGLVSGRNDGRFDPQASASRGEVAQILQNYASLRG